MPEPTPTPAELRKQYAAAMGALLNRPVPPAVTGHHLADAVLAVRDTELQQLQTQLAEARTALRIAEGDRDAAEAAVEQLRVELEDQRAAKQTAAGAADRFRDVLSEALGHDDENPGDDVLVAELRAHFGKTGPEPTAWRDRLVGYEAARDQINAAALADQPARDR